MYVNNNNIVSRNEANALKDIIFQRARERAEALSQKTQSEYTDNFANDIMDIARMSVSHSKNPFAQIINENNIEKEQPQELRVEHENIAEEGIGFAQKKISKQIKVVERTYNSAAAANEIEKNMVAARTNLSNRQNFIGALDFLNQQASLEIAIKKGKKFDVVI